ncbi:hypothetical protein Ndes2526B_g09091 [Nannochloris sp. 'desiccata']
MTTVAQLQNLSYRELQIECKAQGISAKGKADELLGKLIINLQNKDPSTAPSPPPAKKPAGRKSAAASKAAPPPASGTSSRKSIDKNIVQRALGTPLPTTPAKSRTVTAAPSGSRQRTRSRATSLLSLFASTLALWMALFLYVPLICMKVQCPPRVTQVHSKAIDVTQNAVSDVTQWSIAHAARVKQTALVYGTKVTEQARKTSQEASAKLQELMEKIRPDGGSLSSKSSSYAGFNGKLNTAVLKSIVRTNQGAGWEELDLSLTDAWAGGKIAADTNKANVILFVCSSSSNCEETVSELSVAAPVASTLVLNQVELTSGKGHLQSRLAKFFKDQPNGVVVVPDVEQISLDILPVLNNVMGEYGSVMRDGEEISAADATFLLTWQAPPAILAEDSDTSFNLAAKKDLTLLMREDLDGDDEAGQAVVDAFRRRIDLVAPVKPTG